MKPDDIIARASLASVYLSMQSFEEAAQQFRKTLDLDSSSAPLWVNLGHCLFRLGESQAALKTFRKAVELAPNDADNLYNLGDAYFGLGLPEKALALLVKAVQSNDGFALAWYDLGLAFCKVGKYREGAAACRMALLHDPEMRTQSLNCGVGPRKI